MARLIAESGENTGQDYTLLETTILGRMSTNPVWVNDALASREHSKIIREKDGYYIIDLDSHNGTRVNGEKVMTHKLKPGDVITIGHTNLRFDTLNEVINDPESQKPPTINPVIAKPRPKPVIRRAAAPAQPNPVSPPKRIVWFILMLFLLAGIVLATRSLTYAFLKSRQIGIKVPVLPDLK
jgi:pSer/pThr/pTyr-binding forkhead associated (FHA) protein